MYLLVFLEMPSEAALQFFLNGLSAKEGPEIDGAKVVQLGASQLRLVCGSQRELKGLAKAKR